MGTFIAFSIDKVDPGSCVGTAMAPFELMEKILASGGVEAVLALKSEPSIVLRGPAIDATAIAGQVVSDVVLLRYWPLVSILNVSNGPKFSGSNVFQITW